MSETPANENQQKVAVLIDGENVSADLADLIFSNAAAYGSVVVREIYGTATALTSWIQPVLKYAIHPNLTVKASKSKNSSDISLVIGAMDLLSYREIGTVIIVSSDSDFSALSVRLRSGGINVVGMGAEKANPLWRTACSSFVVLNEKKTAMQAAVMARPAAPAQRTVSQSAPAAPAQRQAPQPAPAAAAQKPVSQPAAAVQTAAAVAQPAQAAAPAPAKKPTHEERLNNIRNRIAELLKADNGRMPVTKLFQNLNRFHDYQVDQAGSKRKPLTYLMWAFGNTFFFEETPNGMMVSLEPSPAEQEKKVEAAGAEGAQPVISEKPETAEQKEKNIPNQPVEAVPDEKQEKAAKAGNSSAEAKPETKKPAKKAPAKTKPAARKPGKQADAVPAEASAAAEIPAPAADPGQMPIEEVKAIPARVRKALAAAGHVTLRDAAQVSDAELQAIPQVGAATIASFRKTMKELLGE